MLQVSKAVGEEPAQQVENLTMQKQDLKSQLDRMTTQLAQL